MSPTILLDETILTRLFQLLLVSSICLVFYTRKCSLFSLEFRNFHSATVQITEPTIADKIDDGWSDQARQTRQLQWRRRRREKILAKFTYNAFNMNHTDQKWATKNEYTNARAHTKCEPPTVSRQIFNLFIFCCVRCFFLCLLLPLTHCTPVCVLFFSRKCTSTIARAHTPQPQRTMVANRTLIFIYRLCLRSLFDRPFFFFYSSSLPICWSFVYFLLVKPNISIYIFFLLAKRRTEIFFWMNFTKTHWKFKSNNFSLWFFLIFFWIELSQVIK